MAQKIMSMNRDDLVALMGSNLATPARLGAAVARLSELQAHISSGAVSLVADDGWHHPHVGQLLDRNAGNYWHQVMHAESMQ